MLVVLLTGCLLVVLNQTLLSPALPSIMADLGVNATTAQWLTSGYSLVEAVVIPLSAFLMGTFSTRKLFNGGMAIFATGSLLASLAPNFGVLLAGRMLQAAGTGAIMPMVSTLLLLMFPRERRGTAMGIVGLAIGFAPAVGPSLAGLLVDNVGWHALFGIVFALALLIIILGVALLKNKDGFRKTAFDTPSVALSSLGLVCLLYGLSSLTSSDTIAIPIALIVVGIALVALFAKRQLSLDEPMLKVDILKTRTYRVAVCSIMLIQVALMGMGLIMPLYIQGTLGHGATVSGVTMLPGALLGAIAGMFAGRLFDKHGLRKVSIPGFVAVVLAALAMTTFSSSTNILFVALAYTLLSVGLQFAMTPLNTWGVNSLDNSVVQHAQSLSNTLNQVAGSFGTALLVSISALGPAIAPNSTAPEQTMAGYHLAFCCIFALMALTLVFVCIATRSKTEETRPAASVPAEDSVGAAMNPNPAFVLEGSSLRTVISTMAETDTADMTVVDESGRVTGFISAGDITAYLSRNDVRLFDSSFTMARLADDLDFHQRIDRLMDCDTHTFDKKTVITARDDASLEDAATMLTRHGIKKMPVVRDGKLVGTLSRADVARYIFKHAS